ncbi:S-adenosyl-L-methionine-dependent methyltransferase [Cokeromyces recurvatus]|uniref:S-adenosyl-L-methionine-dependent methyltransferase n=1 Tax=Cokeromyces recurvatus TaxID=90255 RepID=UPI00221E470E|nr:S-adenosyl-L-methionine-dependent methyltransferase [Cokeromyces recurvatus]KAI7901348.1 S-adenosyl-L-methionine-dependent methyltransferase [Cokeromyces recurvatus]
MGIKQSRQNLVSNETYRRESTATQQTLTMNSIRSRSVNSIIIDGRHYYYDENNTSILPRDELEQDRLNSQHFSLKALYEGNILPSVKKLLPANAKVLDLGCGSGCWVMEMAVEHSDYQIIGIDVADMFPTTIRPENVKFELYNILNGLPYPDNSFDYIHMRLLITGLRSEDWPKTIAEIYRVLKPGGVVQLVESDFTEKADIQTVEIFNTEFRKALVELGLDPWIGSKLENLLTETNFDVIEINQKYLDYSLPLDPVAKEMLINWKGAMLSIKPILAQRLNADNEKYKTIVDNYIEGITQAGWKVKMWALCGQKPV